MSSCLPRRTKFQQYPWTSAVAERMATQEETSVAPMKPQKTRTASAGPVHLFGMG
jgi:hypothetical protein